MTTTHTCLDPLCSCRANSREQRERLYPTEAAMSDQMVVNHFEVKATEATFRALFDAFVNREVAACSR